MINKNVLLSAWFLFLTVQLAVGQNVTIVPTGISPNQGAGMAKLSYEEIQALPNPQVGDMVVDMSFKRPRIYDGKQWLLMATFQDAKTPEYATTSLGEYTTRCWINDFEVDAAGTMYLAGRYRGPLKVGDYTLPNYFGYDDAFVAKVNSTGHTEWAVTIANTEENDNVTALARDSQGNIFIGGSFKGTVAFGNTNLTANGRSDMFFAKLNPQGEYIWAKSYGSSTMDEGITDLETDQNDNVFLLTGINSAYNVEGITLSSRGGTDMSVIKFDNNGTYIWHVNAGGSSYDFGHDLKIDHLGNVYFAGSIFERGFIGHFEYELDEYASNAFLNFVACFSNAGSRVWVRTWETYGSLSMDFSILHKSISVNKYRHVFVGGQYTRSAYFNAYYNFPQDSFNPVGEQAYLIRLDGIDYGNLFWVRILGGTRNERISSVASNDNDEVIATGWYNYADALTGDLGLRGRTDIFLTKYDGLGNRKWAESHGGADFDYGRIVNIAPNGLIYTTGEIENSATIGTELIGYPANFIGTYILKRKDD
ncbi:hypothetical protein EGI22_08240 [Lacihabitans sp. LS3-19]|uniref:hypothetical protein n=1 Tax=Lacihabitans sp. LS3-19 TaxID=2487335 RepID=UPI0020CEB9CD|nr:hypothetical protein [Lacihabitans sp. LS3-19]MCP9767899.1 hypothetical protein [Lacihabitans sp. LS3-19]